MILVRTNSDLAFLKTHAYTGAFVGIAIYVWARNVSEVGLVNGIYQMGIDGELRGKAPTQNRHGNLFDTAPAESTLVTALQGRKGLPCKPGYYKERNERKRQKQSESVSAEDDG